MDIVSLVLSVMRLTTPILIAAEACSVNWRAFRIWGWKG